MTTRFFTLFSSKQKILFLIDVEPLLQVFFHNLVGKGVNLADLNKLPFTNGMWIEHTWESASRPKQMPPASAYRNLSYLYGTRAFRYRTESPYSGTIQVPALEFVLILEAD